MNSKITNSSISTKTNIDLSNVYWQMIIDVTNIKKMYISPAGKSPTRAKKSKKKLYIFQFSICHTSIHSTRPIHFHRPVVYHDANSRSFIIVCLTLPWPWWWKCWDKTSHSSEEGLNTVQQLPRPKRLQLDTGHINFNLVANFRFLAIFQNTFQFRLYLCIHCTLWLLVHQILGPAGVSEVHFLHLDIWW